MSLTVIKSAVAIRAVLTRVREETLADPSGRLGSSETRTARCGDLSWSGGLRTLIM
jgi:hypothetical protein